MDITPEDFRRHFDLLSDEALLDTNLEELTELARQCYDEELEKRGLNREVAEEDSSAVETDAAEEPSPEEEELATVATYDNAGDADEAKAILDEAGIPARLVNDAEDMEGAQMELMVAATDLFKALDALGLQISDEELAAQAEAAGMEEE